MSRPTKKPASWWRPFGVRTPAEALAMIVSFGISLSLPAKKRLRSRR